MVYVCLYFQVHQPWRLKKYSYFDIGTNHQYEDIEKNRAILRKIADKCYLPTNALLLKLIKRYSGAFKVSFSISGMAIEQFKNFAPEVLDSFKSLAKTHNVEFLNETYHHSLSSLFSLEEFKEQIKIHKKLIKDEFNYTAKTFRNTELIYNDEIGKFIEELGYKTILAEGATKILGWRSPNFLYRAHGTKDLKMLLRNYMLSDDIAFRFSNKSWSEYPLRADKFANWLYALDGSAEVINLFMDYETFGEHQWEDTGIFAFLEHLPTMILKNPKFVFATPKEIAAKLEAKDVLQFPHSISWADEERDLSAWRSNDLQEDALHSIFNLENKVKETNDKNILASWRRLLTSDHFYYMCIKYSSDGDVHKYFNPYNSPHEAYINFQNIVSDISLEIDKKLKGKRK